MRATHQEKPGQLDPGSIEIRFSAEVVRAFRDLEAAVHFSEHFDGDVQAILHSWATGKPQTLHDVLVALPLIAEETFRHIRATDDQHAELAWREVCNQMPEKGFTILQRRARQQRVQI